MNLALKPLVATPAACYAHTAERDWEADSNVPAGATARDIASQLIDNFGADAIDPAGTDRLLGLFENSHMQYEADRASDGAGEPSLAEMTGKAIDILKKNRKGFFLMVEGGRIDHGHHAGNAYRALTDTIALSDAVRTAMAKTNDDNTLIVVTADHSHTFTIAGYPQRGNPILGKVVEPGKSAYSKAADGMPHTTLSYANGPGQHFLPVGGDTVYSYPPQPGRVADLTLLDTTDQGFHQEALVPLSSETHAGEAEVLGRRALAYRGRLGNGQVEILWLPDLKLAARVTHTAADRRTVHELQAFLTDQDALSATTDAQLAEYRLVDFADLGDMETSPGMAWLKQVVATPRHPAHDH